MTLILPATAKKARKPVRTGTPVRAPRSVEVEYRQSLAELNKATKNATRLIGSSIRAGANRGQVVREIEQQIAISRTRYQAASEQLPGSVIRSLSERNKEQVQNMVKRAMGVDFATIIDSPEVAEELDIAKLQNAQLIKSIPEEHWGRVIQAVSANYEGAEFTEGSLTKRLQKIGNITDNRAKLIARDQTSKLASDLNRIRQLEAGIQGYLWRNSQDIRVVGNPAGLYPKGNSKHENHWEREGKKYSWDKPPSDGHPGQPINCRCRAEPEIILDELNATYL